MAQHTKDSDCTLDATDTCTVCGAYHGEPCIDCGGMAYHNFGCPTQEPIPPAEEIVQDLADHLAELLARSDVPDDAEPYKALRAARRFLGQEA